MGLIQIYEGHKREAERSNFKHCGCDYCKLLKPLIPEVKS